MLGCVSPHRRELMPEQTIFFSIVLTFGTSTKRMSKRSDDYRIRRTMYIIPPLWRCPKLGCSTTKKRVPNTELYVFGQLLARCFQRRRFWGRHYSNYCGDIEHGTSAQGCVIFTAGVYGTAAATRSDRGCSAKERDVFKGQATKRGVHDTCAA